VLGTPLKRNYGFFEPDDLVTEPDIPEYSALNINIKGYDFVPVESFAKYVHNLVSSLDLVSTVYPTPARSSHIEVFKPNSTNVLHTYQLATYDRTIQVENLPSTTASVLFQVIQSNTPEGVKVCIKPPDAEEEEFRYVPDLMLIELQSQIDEIDQAREDRKKK